MRRRNALHGFGCVACDVKEGSGDRYIECRHPRVVHRALTPAPPAHRRPALHTSCGGCRRGGALRGLVGAASSVGEGIGFWCEALVETGGGGIMMARGHGASLLGLLIVVAALVLMSASEVNGQLSFTYYRKSCPKVESIVLAEMKKAFKKNPTIAPGILRMMFHDCFVRGCDASVLLAGSKTERASIRNNRLHGFEVIDQIKAALEKACPRTVSCADILAYASRDAVVVTGGLRWKVMGGRRDGRVSNKVEPEQNLPSGFAHAQELISTFSQQGLTPQQMVDLSGSHTLGVTHCEHIRNRIFKPVDRSMPKDLLAKLQKRCPKPTTGTPIVLDQTSQYKFDTAYFKNIKAGRGLMTSDQDLYNAGAGLRQYVDKNLNQNTFVKRFGAAMFALSNINPTLAPDGEIRKRCQYRN